MIYSTYSCKTYWSPHFGVIFIVKGAGIHHLMTFQICMGHSPMGAMFFRCNSCNICQRLCNDKEPMWCPRRLNNMFDFCFLFHMKCFTYLFFGNPFFPSMNWFHSSFRLGNTGWGYECHCSWRHQKDLTLSIVTFREEFCIVLHNDVIDPVIGCKRFACMLILRCATFSCIPFGNLKSG